jgi:hypothetical protein
MAHTPISMRCTQEQFEEIRPILEANGKTINDSGFHDNTVLVSNTDGYDVIARVHESFKNEHGRVYYDVYNKEIFLDACGITTDKSEPIETENQYDVASRIVIIFNRMQNGKLAPTSAGELIAAKIEAYAEMKVQEAKGGSNE